MEIVKGKISRWEDDGGVIIRAFVPNLDRALLRRYSDVLIEFEDGRSLSVDQRKKAHALINEIADWAGYLPSEMKRLMKIEFKVKHLQTLEQDMFSLANCSVTTAREFISFLIDFMLENGVPSKVPLYEQCDDVERYVYSCLMHRVCAICGRPADLHHVDRVGMGFDRRTKYQIGARVISLCRLHHSELHSTGDEKYLAKYHLEGIPLTREIGKVYKLTKKALGEQ